MHALELVVHVVDHFGQRQVVGQHGPRRREVLGPHVHAAAVGAELHHRADRLGRQHEVHPHDRLAELLDLAGVGHFLRVVDVQRLAVRGEDFVGDVGRGLHQVEIGLLPSSRCWMISMCSRPRKPQRKPKPRASLVSGSNSKLGSLIAELVERVAQLLEILAVGRIQPAVDHPLRLLDSRAAARRRSSPGMLTVSPMWTWPSDLMLQIR